MNLVEMLRPEAVFVIMTLATYRIARLITIENGPFACFTDLRQWGGCEPGENPPAYKTPFPGSFAEWIQCPWCMAVPIGYVLWFALVVVPNLTLVVCIPLATAAASGWLYQRE